MRPGQPAADSGLPPPLGGPQVQHLTLERRRRALARRLNAEGA
jgi:hypothetical protein